MKYTVTGTGIGDAKLVYEKGTLPEAYYVASKMADSGVADVQIIDGNGSDISLEEAFQAFRQNPLPGWTVR